MVGLLHLASSIFMFVKNRGSGRELDYPSQLEYKAYKAASDAVNDEKVTDMDVQEAFQHIVKVVLKDLEHLTKPLKLSVFLLGFSKWLSIKRLKCFNSIIYVILIETFNRVF